MQLSYRTVVMLATGRILDTHHSFHDYTAHVYSRPDYAAQGVLDWADDVERHHPHTECTLHAIVDASGVSVLRVEAPSGSRHTWRNFRL